MRCGVIIAWLAVLTPTPAAAAPGITLLLDIVLNGRDTGQIRSFVQRGTALVGHRQDLQALGLILPPPMPGEDPKLIALDRLKHLSFRIDAASQTLDIQAGWGGVKATQINGSATGTDALPVQSSLGALLSYDILATRSDGTAASQSIVSSTVDLRIFSPAGVFDSDFLAATGTSATPLIRLDSVYSYADSDRMRQFELGDFINGSLSWSRPVRLGGMQLATNFAMRPDLVTYPLPAISGQAAVPSSVDVLIDGVKQLSAAVDAGPFAVTQLPVVSGSGEISVVVKNALGQQVTETLPFYASASLLDPGLVSYSVETGFVRQGYGTLSNDYKTAAASATWLRGMTSWATLEAHGEATPNLAMGGGGIVFTLDDFALISLAGAMSRNAGNSGSQYALGFQHSDRNFNFNASIQKASAGFQDLAGVNGDPVPQMTLQAGGGINFSGMGSLGVNFTKVDSIDEHDAIATISYARPLFRRLYVSADAYRNFAGAGSSGLLFSLSFSFGQRGSVSINPSVSDGQSTGSVQATQSVASVGDAGWQVLGSDGQDQPAHEYGEFDYKAPFGLFGLGLDQDGATHTIRATAAGSIALADGSLFATNTIYDSFAVVDTDGVKGVAVTAENRPAGSTDAAGKLLLPDLRSFEANHIAINPDDVPINDDISAPAQIIRPMAGAGVVVKFPIHASAGAILRLVDAVGKALPLGSAATRAGSATALAVGYDGEVFIQDLQPSNVVTVTAPNGKTCEVRFRFTPVPDRLPRIGPLLCRTSTAR